MPVYAYTCTACSHSFDIQQSFSDDALTVCPECSGRLRKIFSTVGVTFKGSGFYRTDSRANAGEGKKDPASSKSDSSTSTAPAPAKTTTSA